MRRIFAISDLHIGGAEHPMLGHPEVLVDFLARVAAIDGSELVVHGDFVDFLAESPYQAWTPDEETTLAKLHAIFARNPAVFDAFAKCARGPGRLTILLGNHDVELAYPKVRDALFARLGTTPHACLFVHGDEGYRVGDVFIEHGNRYDPWNAVEYDELHRVLAAVGRGEAAPAMKPCPGSSLVEKVMNPLKERYHFIDLLKPEDKIVMLLIMAFEPERLSDVKMMYHAVSALLRQLVRKGARVMRGGEDDELSQELRAAFAEDLRALRGEVAQRRMRGPIIKASSDSLANLLREGRPVDAKRAAKLQLALRTKISGDVSFAPADDSGDYSAAAREMTGRDGTRLVVMGHTHLARDVPFNNGGRYFNTGTWADLIRVDEGALHDRTADRAVFVEWLRKLVTNDLGGMRVCRPGFADVTVGADGHIVGAPRLRIHEVGAEV